jgi:hypothetical protein
MSKSKLEINSQSIKTELRSYKNKPYDCLFEYIWNSFDAGATEIKINFDTPLEGIGIASNVKIIDNGTGWDFDNNEITNNFISSTKESLNNKTLPKGHYGRGRYTFIWISDKIEIYSKNKKLTLNHNTEINKENFELINIGTEIKFIGITYNFSSILLDEDNLHKEILLHFGWFLQENEKYKIIINNKEIDINKNVKDTIILKRDSFDKDIVNKIDIEFEAKIILWEVKPSEFSKFYFLNNQSIEVFKKNTGLNKKGDSFWHSIYIKSKLFETIEDIEENDIKNDKEQRIMDFNDKELKKIKNKILNKIKEELIKLRKPYLIQQSSSLLKELKEENLIPELSDFGIYDEDSYDDLLKIIYTISPSLFVGKNDSEKKFICATFAGLLSNNDDNLIKIILEQLQELTEDEKTDLLDILNRTTLSNIVKTTKEIDHRLNVLDKLKVLISEHEKETLEVKHIQKVLDHNFWIFGEQFRLFSTTEGALKNVLVKYAKEILEIQDPELETQPNGEVDLFLTKTESVGEKIQKNIVVEIKRASKKLTEEKEYKQINDYRKRILEQTLCNGENQYWEFYLIGKSYDKGINELIENSKNHGEKEKGLSLCINDGRVKIYVRKWSDVLEVEWGTKMKYLKEKLQIQLNKPENNNVNDITKKIRG